MRSKLHSDYLFLYGTLHPDRAPASIVDTARQLIPLGSATIQGRKYDLGDYPGVVLIEDEAEIVHGEVFVLPAKDSMEILGRLDAYEDCRPLDPQGSLFLRQLTTAMMNDGTRLKCWVYTYNGALEEHRLSVKRISTSKRK